MGLSLLGGQANSAGSGIRLTSSCCKFAHNGPGRLIPNLGHLLFQGSSSGSSMSTCTVQVTPCTWTKIIVYVSYSIFNSPR